MKRILLMAVIVLNFSACDNSKMQLRAPQPNQVNAAAAAEKTDTLHVDTLHADSVVGLQH